MCGSGYFIFFSLQIHSFIRLDVDGEREGGREKNCHDVQGPKRTVADVRGCVSCEYGSHQTPNTFALVYFIVYHSQCMRPAYSTILHLHLDENEIKKREKKTKRELNRQCHNQQPEEPVLQTVPASVSTEWFLCLAVLLCSCRRRCRHCYRNRRPFIWTTCSVAEWNPVEPLSCDACICTPRTNPISYTPLGEHYVYIYK